MGKVDLSWGLYRGAGMIDLGQIRLHHVVQANWLFLAAGLKPAANELAATAEAGC